MSAPTLDPRLAAVARWGRWLQILLVVGFVLDVLHAVVVYGRLEQLRSLGHASFLPVLQGGSALNEVPGSGRWLVFFLAAALVPPWWTATVRLLGERLSPPPAGPRALLRLDELEELSEFKPRLLISGVAFLGGLLVLAFGFYLFCVAMRPSLSVLTEQLELGAAVVMALSGLGVVLTVEASRRISLPTTTQAAPVPSVSLPESPPPPQPILLRQRASPGLPAVPAKAGGAACLGCGSQMAGECCTQCGARRLIAGYRVEAVLAQRAHGRTYRALSESGHPVVIKEVIFARAPDAKALVDFEREAALLGQLNHPRLPRLIESFHQGEGGERRDYVVLEWLEGHPLSEEVSPGRVMPPQRVLEVVREVLQLLTVLQARSPMVVHRDIKPANILRLASGRIALVDFGGARELSNRSAEGTLVGTVGYMPREQLAGRVDATSDVYALGATAIHLLTGLSPSDLMDGEAHLQLPPTLPVPREMARVLRRMVASSAGQRFRDARAALRAFEEATRGPSQLPKVLGVIAAGLTVVVGVSWWSRRPAKVSAEVAAASPARSTAFQETAEPPAVAPPTTAAPRESSAARGIVEARATIPAPGSPEFATYRDSLFHTWMPKGTRATAEGVYRVFNTRRYGPVQWQLNARYFQGQAGRDEYTVEILPLPPKLPIEDVLTALYDFAARLSTVQFAATGGVQIADYTVPSQGLVTWPQGYPGRDFNIRSTDGQQRYWVRVILTPDQIVYLMVRRPEEQNLDADALRFFRDFWIDAREPELLRNVPHFEWFNCPANTPVPLEGQPLPDCAAQLPPYALRTTQAQ